MPGAFDAQNAAVKLTIFHGYWMEPGTVRVHLALARPEHIHTRGHKAARNTRGDAQGGFQRSGLKPLLWG